MPKMPQWDNTPPWFIHILSDEPSHAPEHAIGRFPHGCLTRACRVMADVRPKSNIRMIKLYLKTKSVMRYHEAWISGSKVVEHWGVVGDRGESREHKKDRKRSDEENILAVLAEPLAKGYAPIDDDDLDVLMIEYAIDGMGNKKDLKKRHDLEDRMNETLGWTGLGNCDGGSTGSGTMEVCCFVVDFKTAKRVIEKDLAESKFSDFTRIYAE